MANAYRPDSYLIETGSRAVGERLRTFAADFIEAVAEFVVFVAVLLDKATFVKVGAALTLVMDSPAICKEWTLEVVEQR